ncbi:FAST kinase domain-containing protein 4 isoform X2 [Bradysia coprophila]|uniref:FAST kinase domain-containing protein 4 isoform X2 n=1 Tax=Bradysia coprophila TaxID=38358 RepID=UPI00187D77F8|nr:FAST kinase domain-containing protein 4 isoform X2 [Bradysia coprophila]XP_037025723.1 FAST kinase domain-containing protein 4 isoform X2 [Bradysia coprophila]XP_037025724.1 FAST kinase domain-containing protein 4 isoform X2 [Bradysia coprophila]
MLQLHRLVARTLGPTVSRTRYSTTTIPKPVIAKNKKSNDEITKKSEERPPIKRPMIAALFKSLQTINENDDVLPDAKPKTSKSSVIDERILSATNVTELLSVAESNPGMTRKQSLKIVSILAEWSSINRAKLSDFENDARFIKLCRQLGRPVAKINGETVQNNSKLSAFQTDDLNTVIDIAGGDEAAKLIASISVSQMIRVMSALAAKKRRSTPLLRSLAFHISSSSECLNLKECADLLYSMAVLSFPDSVLIARVSMDIQTGLAKNIDKPAVVGSIITSLGLLKFLNLDVLENLTDWIVKHRDICRPHDISSLFMTLATLNYRTNKSDELKSQLVASLREEDFPKSSEWLNHVWSLVLLDFAETKHFESVLRKEFIETLVFERKSDLLPTMKLKLLNINAAAKCLNPPYAGPTLAENSGIFSVPLTLSKSKTTLLDGLMDTLKHLFSASNLIRTQHDTRMGFVIDAECVLDSKGNPLPVDQEHKNSTRVAMMIRDFHDLCQGVHQHLSGPAALSHKLLEQAGYKVVMIPYNECSTSDKMIKRVQYLQDKLKRITSKKD